MSIAGVAIDLAERSQVQGGVPVAAAGAPPGTLVDAIGSLEYDGMLVGGVSAAGWLELVGWRNLADADVADTPKPLGPGAYPGSVYAQSLTVTLTALVRGLPDAKAAAIDTVVAHTRMDGVERPLVVRDDAGGPWVRMARVVAREVPQDKHYRHGPVQVSVQWLCSDPRRYTLRAESVLLLLGQSSGGLVYPLDYGHGLDYGTTTNNTRTATNRGNAATPVRVLFRGPLTTPALRIGGNLLEYAVTLAAGETLRVDTRDGTALLNGRTDRSYAITARSAPVEACELPPGDTDLSLTAAAGTGSASVAYSHAEQ